MHCALWQVDRFDTRWLLLYHPPQTNRAIPTDRRDQCTGGIDIHSQDGGLVPLDQFQQLAILDIPDPHFCVVAP